MAKDSIALAQIGCGYWGPNLLRNFSALPQVHVKYLVDLSPERRTFVEQNFPKTKTIDDPQCVWDNPNIAAVVIATPAGSHFDLGQKALAHGKHILMGKPAVRRATLENTG